MADNKINDKAIDSDSINGISKRHLDKLNSDQLKAVIDKKLDDDQKKNEAGKIGKWIGTNPQNASINSALILCIVVLLLCVIDLVHSFSIKGSINMEMWNLVFPVITLALGYIFGKGGNP